MKILKMKKQSAISNQQSAINSGFTLIELLVVIVVLGVLAVALLVGINPLEQIRKAKDAGMVSKAKEAIGAAERYKTFFGTDPANCAALLTAQELKGDVCTGLSNLTASGDSFTIDFTPVSKAYQDTTMCGATCTIPTDIATIGGS